METREQTTNMDSSS